MILVDITHTVKASESNGRTLFKDLETGEILWERRAVPRDENTVWPLPVTQPEEVEAALEEPEPKVDLIAARNKDVDVALNDAVNKELLSEALQEPLPAPAPKKGKK